MATADLFDWTETSLMTAGHHLSTARNTHEYTHLSAALQQAEWVVEGLRALCAR